MNYGFSVLFLALLMTTALLVPGTGFAEEPSEAEPPRTRVERHADRQEEVGILASENREFAFSLLVSIRRDASNENIFFSPFSISRTLAMIYAGARGQTRAELERALKYSLDDESLHRAFNALSTRLSPQSMMFSNRDPQSAELHFYSRFWGQREYPFRTSFLNLLARSYDTSLQGVDFRNNSGAILQEINDWVREKSNNRIPRMLENIDPGAAFVLVNGIYFSGYWELEFDEGSTSPSPFHRLDGSSADVPMMRNLDNFRIHQRENTTAVRMDYQGPGPIALLAMKPSDEESFAEWEEKLSRHLVDEIIEELRITTRTEIHLEFPRFETRTNYNLAERILPALGLSTLFRLSADLTGMYEPSDLDPLFVNQFIHRTFIKVDEKKTEATAFDAVAGLRGSAPRDYKRISFNRPFYFVIYDYRTDSILFLGRMLDPLR